MVILGAGRKDNGIKGFTLVEILVVVVIFAVLAKIAGSMFTNFRHNTNLREAAGALAEDMKLAKQRAVAENVNYTIIFDINSNNYTMNKYDSNGNMITPPIKTVNLSDFGIGIVINSQNFTGNTVTFQPRGTCSAGTIKLKNSINSELDIITTLMGKVTIVKIA